MVSIRQATLEEANSIAAMCALLWSDVSAEEHAGDVRSILETGRCGTLPAAFWVAEESGTLIGFLQVGLRSHADGCDPQHPVGFIEGWFVREESRGREIGGRLLQAAEGWAREQGCHEMASDTWIDHTVSQQIHEALGFEIVDRCVNFRKQLV